MSISLGVIMDPIEDIAFYKDTSLALLLAAQERGWELHYMEQGDLSLRHGQPRAKMHTLHPPNTPDHWYDLEPRHDRPLDELDVILMRKDPPFNSEYTYSTYILEAAQKRGALVVNDPRSLRDCNEKIFATSFPQCCPPLLVSRDSAQIGRASCRGIGRMRVGVRDGHVTGVQSCALPILDVILMRKDPPFNSEYTYSTYILEAAQTRGALVVNDPRSLRDCNEKIFATSFPQCCPPLLVSRDSARLKEFHREHGDVIFKPLEGMGGSSVFRCREDDPNVSVILETLTQFGQQMIMAQRYIPEITKGDKRILVVDGEAVPYALARIPAEGETRGNLAAGGTGVAQPLSERDRWIVSQVAPELKRRGLLFVGLDVIGDYLTEINVTSPTCVQELDRAHNTAIGARLMDAIERHLQKSRNA